MKRDPADGQYFLTGDELVDALEDIEPRLKKRGEPIPDPVRRPAHYNHLPIECVEIAKHFNYCLGNVIKYVYRADYKGDPITDLRKAAEYLAIEIDRRLAELSKST